MKYTTTLLIAVVSFILLSCAEKKDQAHELLNTSAFEEKLNTTADKILLDVRTPEEYGKGHLPNAILINVNGEDFNARINELDKSKPVFVYCAAGIRSEKASAILNDQGFKKVYDLEGGFNAWSGEGKPVAND